MTHFCPFHREKGCTQQHRFGRKTQKGNDECSRLVVHNQLQYQAVVFVGGAGVDEELLVVEPYARAHRTADEVHGEAGGDALPVVAPLVIARV